MIQIFLNFIVISFLITNIYPQTLFPKRELRGAWIATVKNIDWPSSNNETTDQQKNELIDLLDKLKSAGINAVYFQVRTECDALYKSKYEPWSYWLTGQQGKAPKPFYDPLKFAIEEAHKRGIEFHAWFNPYRAIRQVGDYQISSEHVSIKHPEWILDFNEYKMLNPGIPAVRDYIASIISDVVRRYNLDGIHFDDYFYPYVPIISNEDSVTFDKYSSGYTDVDDWRRFNINSMIAQCYDSILTIKPDVKFGVSPFGVVENKYAATNGFNSYDKIYCDPLNWINNKTVDYVIPQIYWKIGDSKSDYKLLLPWWASVVNDRQLYIGLFSSKFANDDYDSSKTEIENQIKLNRETSNVLGSVLFSAKSISQNYGGLADSLKNNLFKYPALLPIMPWKDLTPPVPPFDLNVEGNIESRILTWKCYFINTSNNFYNAPTGIVIYKFAKGERINLNDAAKIITILYTKENSFLDESPLNDSDSVTYVITTINRLNIESGPSNKVVFRTLNLK